MSKCPHDQIEMAVPKCHCHTCGLPYPTHIDSQSLSFLNYKMGSWYLPWLCPRFVSGGNEMKLWKPIVVDLLRGSCCSYTVYKMLPDRSRGAKGQAVITVDALLTPGKLLLLSHHHVQAREKDGWRVPELPSTLIHESTHLQMLRKL